MNAFETEFFSLVSAIAGEVHTIENMDSFREPSYLSFVVKRFLETVKADSSEAEQQVRELVQSIEVLYQAILAARPTYQERRVILSQQAATNDFRDLMGIYWLSLLAFGMMAATAVCVYYTVNYLQAIRSLDSFPGWSQCKSPCSHSYHDCTTYCYDNYLAGSERQNCDADCSDKQTDCLQNCSVSLLNSTNAYINIPNTNINLGAESFGLIMGALVSLILSVMCWLPIITHIPSIHRIMPNILLRISISTVRPLLRYFGMPVLFDFCRQTFTLTFNDYASLKADELLPEHSTSFLALLEGFDALTTEAYRIDRISLANVPALIRLRALELALMLQLSPTHGVVSSQEGVSLASGESLSVLHNTAIRMLTASVEELMPSVNCQADTYISSSNISINADESTALLPVHQLSGIAKECSYSFNNDHISLFYLRFRESQSFMEQASESRLHLLDSDSDSDLANVIHNMV